MAKRDAESRRAALKVFMGRRNIKVASWARDSGVNPNQIYGFLKGRQDDMGAGSYEALATAAGTSVDELLGHTDDAQHRILATTTPLMSEMALEYRLVDLMEEAASQPEVLQAIIKVITFLKTNNVTDPAPKKTNPGVGEDR